MAAYTFFTNPMSRESEVLRPVRQLQQQRGGDRHLGGLGLDWVGRAAVFEEAGRSYLGPAALNCAAPDQPNTPVLSNRRSPRVVMPRGSPPISSFFIEIQGWANVDFGPQ